MVRTGSELEPLLHKRAKVGCQHAAKALISQHVQRCRYSEELYALFCTDRQAWVPISCLTFMSTKRYQQRGERRTESEYKCCQLTSIEIKSTIYYTAKMFSFVHVAEIEACFFAHSGNRRACRLDYIRGLHKVEE